MCENLENANSRINERLLDERVNHEVAESLSRSLRRIQDVSLSERKRQARERLYLVRYE